MYLGSIIAPEEYLVTVYRRTLHRETVLFGGHFEPLLIQGKVQKDEKESETNFTVGAIGLLNFSC